MKEGISRQKSAIWRFLFGDIWSATTFELYSTFHLMLSSATIRDPVLFKIIEIYLEKIFLITFYHDVITFPISIFLLVCFNALTGDKK